MERRYKHSAHPHLRPLGTVDSVCTMGTVPLYSTTISTTIQNSHSPTLARGLFCAQLLARMLYPLAKAAIARHLAAHFVYAVNHGRMVPAAERLTDLDQLHFQ
ncbi:MAG: hypothetical protein QOH59_2861 [Gemmatimonadales bacterium]|nr:hypothetical protein [Gemmatimonadales bacterium]